MTRLIIGNHTPLRKVRSWRRRHAGGELTLDPALSADELAAMSERYSAEPYATEIHQLAVLHPSADIGVFRTVLRIAGTDAGLQNTIVTSSRASRELVTELANSEHESVREHARVALLTMDLDEGRVLDFRSVIDGAVGDGGIGLRWTLAQHHGTPSEVLEELSRDDADIIADAARSQLESRTKAKS